MGNNWLGRSTVDKSDRSNKIILAAISAFLPKVDLRTLISVFLYRCNKMVLYCSANSTRQLHEILHRRHYQLVFELVKVYPNIEKIERWILFVGRRPWRREQFKDRVVNYYYCVSFKWQASNRSEKEKIDTLKRRIISAYLWLATFSYIFSRVE